MNKILLSIISLLNPFWRSLGVDPRHLYTIVEVKLIMDGRRKSSVSYLSNRSTQKEVKGQDVLTMVAFGLLGFLFMSFMVALSNRPSGIFVFFSGFMTFLAMTLISDFTDVLIDVRDNAVLLPCPVSGRTLGVSRILHVFFYLIKLIVPLTLPALVFIAAYDGILALLLFSILALMATILTLLLVNLVYLALMRWTSPRRFKEIINIIQVVFFGFTFAGYQLIPRLVGASFGADINLLNNHWFGWAPSSWLAAIWSWWMMGVTTPYIYGWAILGLAMPFVAIYLIAQFLSKGFTSKLISLDEGEGNTESKVPTTSNNQLSRQSWMAMTSNWFCTNRTEKASYELGWRMTQRSRDFKLKFYPNVIMLVVYFFGIFLSGSGGFKERLENLHEFPFMHLMVLYFAALIAMSGNSLTMYSDQYKGVWIYLVNPVAQPGYLLSGVFKMILVRFFLPIYLCISVMCLAIWGIPIIGDLVAAFANILFLSICTSSVTNTYLPFSYPWEEVSKGRNVGLSILTMFFSGFIGLCHFGLAYYFPIGVWVMVPISGFLFFRVMRYYQQLKWRNISLN